MYKKNIVVTNEMILRWYTGKSTLNLSPIIKTTEPPNFLNLFYADSKFFFASSASWTQTIDLGLIGLINF